MRNDHVPKPVSNMLAHQPPHVTDVSVALFPWRMQNKDRICSTVATRAAVSCGRAVSPAATDMGLQDIDGPHGLSQEWQAQGGRRLQQGGVTPTPVATAQELLAAVSDGAQHIQITAHLDMSAFAVPSNPLYTDYDPAPETSFEYMIYVNSSLTNTLTVRVHMCCGASCLLVLLSTCCSGHVSKPHCKSDCIYHAIQEL